MISARIQQIKRKIDLRTYIVVKNAIYSLGIKGLSIIVGLLLMPVYAKFLLNQSVLGVWLTIISMLSWIFTFDLGIGNGLRNELTIAVAQNDTAAKRKIITSAYFSAIVICLVLAALLCIGVKFVDYFSLFHLDKSVIDERTVNNAIFLLIIGVLVQFVLKLINSVLLALHKSAIPNALSLISNSVMLLYLYLTPVHSINDSFSLLAVIFVVATNLPMLIATIAVFSTTLKDCVPSFKEFRMNDAKRIVKIGLAFFWLQIMAMIILSTNNFLITIFVGAEEVIPFQTYFRLFSLISTFFSLGMIPLWSSIAEAQAKNDFAWIIRTRKSLYLMLGAAVIGEAAILVMSKFVVTVWMGPQYVIPSLSLVIFFAIYDLVDIWSLINAQIANGLGKLKNQLVFLTFGAIINFPLSYLFSVIYKSWVAIAIANILSLLPFCISETLSTTIYLNRRAYTFPKRCLYSKIKKEFDAR